MIDAFEIIVIIFAVFALSRAVLRYKDSAISAKELVFWILIWLAVIVLILVQDSLWFLTKIISIGRPVDLIIYASIVLLFYLLFRIYVKVDKMEQAITTLTREISIKRAKKRNK